jgi:hypothetical protein
LLFSTLVLLLLELIAAFHPAVSAAAAAAHLAHVSCQPVGLLEQKVPVRQRPMGVLKAGPIAQRQALILSLSSPAGKERMATKESLSNDGLTK